MQFFFFYLFSAVAVLSALAVILLPKPTRALVALIVTMSSLSCLYVLLGAPLMAMINLIVYAGAVLVLFLFVIMLLGIGAKDIPVAQRFHPLLIPTAGVTSLGFLTALVLSARRFLIPPSTGIALDVKTLGRILFSEFLLPFELMSFLLLLAIFAAVALAKKEEQP